MNAPEPGVQATGDRAWRHWSAADDAALLARLPGGILKAIVEQADLDAVATALGRTSVAVKARVYRLRVAARVQGPGLRWRCQTRAGGLVEQCAGAVAGETPAPQARHGDLWAAANRRVGERRRQEARS